MPIAEGLFLILVTCGMPTLDRDGHGSDRPEALKLLREAASAVEHDSRSAPLLMDVAVGFAKAGDAEEAAKIVDTIGHDIYRDEARLAIAAVAAEAGRTALAFRLADELDRHRRVQAVAYISLSQVRASGVDEAIRTIETRLGDANDRSTAFSLLANTLDSMGFPAGAEVIHRKLSSTDPPSFARALRSAARSKIGEGDFKAALKLADEVDRAFRAAPAPTPVGKDHRSGFLPPDPRFYVAGLLSDIAQAMAQSGEFDDAIEVADRIPPPHLRASTLARIAATGASSAGRDKVKALIDRAAGIASEGRGPTYGMAEIGVAQIAIGDLDEARDTFARAIASNGPGNRIGIIRTQAKAGDIEGAMRNAEAIAFRHERELALGQIARELALVGRAEEAIASAEGFVSPDARAEAFRDIAEAHDRSSRRDEAVALLRRASAVDGRLPPELARSISRFRGRCKDNEDTARWARSTPDPLTRAYILLGLAEAILPESRIPPLRAASN